MASTSLAVFDFDRTIVDDDSDATIINRLREKEPPPEWEAGNHDWTPYMSDVTAINQSLSQSAGHKALPRCATTSCPPPSASSPPPSASSPPPSASSPPPSASSLSQPPSPSHQVFAHAYSAGLSQDDILDCIGSMRPTPGVEKLITTLAAEGWDIVLVTDANTVFVQHWLKVHGLLDCITEIITNRAFWQGDRLFIEPCMRQTSCPRCPSNLCKSRALVEWCAKRAYGKIVYCGDGRNDYCPSMFLPANAIVFPRRGYPLDDLIKKTLTSPTPQVKARVVPWTDCHVILQVIFPGKFTETTSIASLQM